MTTARTRLRTAIRSGIAAVLIAVCSAAPAQAFPVSGAVYGDPFVAAQYWQQQTLSDSCVLLTVADVVGQLTGDLPTEKEMLAIAGRTKSEAHDGYIFLTDDEYWGTSYRDVPVLLRHFGIKAVKTDTNLQDQVHVATGMAALAQYLAEGERVIVGLNGETIWNSDGDRSEAAHAVVVTGIDLTRGVVHTNDPWLSTGRDQKVSLATFEQAWRTGEYIMIVTDERA